MISCVRKVCSKARMRIGSGGLGVFGVLLVPFFGMHCTIMRSAWHLSKERVLLVRKRSRVCIYTPVGHKSARCIMSSRKTLVNTLLPHQTMICTSYVWCLVSCAFQLARLLVIAYHEFIKAAIMLKVTQSLPKVSRTLLIIFTICLRPFRRPPKRFADPFCSFYPIRLGYIEHVLHAPPTSMSKLPYNPQHRAVQSLISKMLECSTTRFSKNMYRQK